MLKKTLCTLMMALATLAGCSSSEAAGEGGSAGTGGSAGAGGAGGAGGTSGDVQDVRGDRYCEILVGHLEGTTVHIGVYNTYQLNDCPEAAWDAVDPAAIKASEGADAVILNGPRYWVMDAFEHSKLADGAVKTLGGIGMRLAGTLDVPVAEVMGGEKPYAPRAVARTTTWVYEAKRSVYELVDPSGKVYDMQSYSVQKAPQTEDSLASLGEELAVPSGWKFRTRVLDAELTVTAVDGMATVVQDELGNTYQLSQQ